MGGAEERPKALPGIAARSHGERVWQREAHAIKFRR
jgi:hypothetical protein